MISNKNLMLMKQWGEFYLQHQPQSKESETLLKDIMAVISSKIDNGDQT